MQIHADIRTKQSEIVEKPYMVTDIIELSESEYYSLYQDLTKKRSYFVKSDNLISTHDEQGCILVLGEGQKDGILVDTQGLHYAYLSAFISDARALVKNHIKQLADYVISESTECTEDGNWSIYYEELYYHFGANITDTNGNGKLLLEELLKREEINELIMIEDCIEITCHLEYCENCQEGGIEDAMDLLSLMGCNLYDVHFEHEQNEFDYATVSELNKDTLTEEGKKEWADVLYATVESIRNGSSGIICKLVDCDPFRLKAFTEMLNGQCEAEKYDAWVKRSEKTYTSTTEQNGSSFESRYNADLVATYEELTRVPTEEHTTAYFGDLSLHHFKYGVTEEQIRPVYEKAIAAMEMTEDEFKSQNERFRYRGEIIGRMRECLLTNELHTGEEVLFVATEPYSANDDFALRGGVILNINKEQKNCKVRGEFFTMDDVPLRYILGRHDMHSDGTHYGFENVLPLFGEHPTLAHHYLKEAEEKYTLKMNSEQAQSDGSTTVFSM